MAFTSFRFVVFFVVVYALLWLVKWVFGKKDFYQSVYKVFLLLASYAFMAFADWRFAVCILLLTAAVYFAALLKSNKVVFTAGVVISIAQLAVFKYFNFFVGSFAALLGSTYTTVNIIVPLGVSFYTFSALSYIIDVYRGKYEAEKDFINVALYMSFFPKLTSGPIVRADKFLSQLKNKPCIDFDRFKIGIQIVVCGFFKKMVLADHLNIFVNDVFGSPCAFTGATVFLATIAYSLQIYFDFSGYSDIAIGFSKMMGFDFEKNFNLPYLSLNPTEFWKRWHISLSSWLQEYLYYPLGGNRKGKIRTYVNLFLTMLIGGLWHGADWTFIVWGGINGLGLVVHKLFVNWKVKKFGRKDAGGAVWKICSGILTFLFANFCWIFFRADSLTNAVNVIKQIFYTGVGIRQPYTWAFFALLIALAEIIAAICRRNKNMGKPEHEYLIFDLSKVIPLALFLTLIGITIMMAYVGNTAFIYGNF
ncbi:MAG: MBOAT family O-acyltransferase [Eubacteriales bacterium]|nr:MBOAT family O-acyltransferase [Eubacteriales bacterium]